MKKVIALILVFATSLLLCSCSAFISEKDMNTFLSSLSDSRYFDEEASAATLEKCTNTKEFPALLESHMSNLLAEEEYESSINLISRLNTLGYSSENLCTALDTNILNLLNNSQTEDETIKALKVIKGLSRNNYSSENLINQFREWVFNRRDAAFEGEASDMINYVELVKSRLDGNDYVTIIECFPYHEMKNYIESNGSKAVTLDNNGGYYDNTKGSYEDESYWYSPLENKKSSKGSVGTYYHEVSHEFLGDFMLASTTKYWYETARNDSSNSYSTEMYFKGEYIGNNGQLDFYTLEYEIFPTNNVYYLQSDNDYMIAYIREGNIIIIHQCEMVTIAYE